MSQSTCSAHLDGKEWTFVSYVSGIYDEFKDWIESQCSESINLELNKKSDAVAKMTSFSHQAVLTWWTYSSIVFDMSKLTTSLTLTRSSPLPNTPVLITTSKSPSRRPWRHSTANITQSDIFSTVNTYYNYIDCECYEWTHFHQYATWF